jgi:hypothetical protein
VSTAQTTNPNQQNGNAGVRANTVWPKQTVTKQVPAASEHFHTDESGGDVEDEDQANTESSEDEDDDKELDDFDLSEQDHEPRASFGDRGDHEDNDFNNDHYDQHNHYDQRDHNDFHEHHDQYDNNLNDNFDDLHQLISGTIDHARVHTGGELEPDGNIGKLILYTFIDCGIHCVVFAGIDQISPDEDERNAQEFLQQPTTKSMQKRKQKRGGPCVHIYKLTNTNFSLQWPVLHGNHQAMYVSILYIHYLPDVFLF